MALYRSPFTVVEPLVSRPHGFDSLIVGYCSGKDLVVQWDLRESMTEAEVEIILQRAREKYPEAKPRIISDNGPQFIARTSRSSSALRDDACAHIALLPAIERQAGTLAQIPKIGVPSAWHTVDQGRCRAPDSNLRGSLQHRTLAQRHRLCDAARYARRAAGRNPRGTRSQARGSASPTAAPTSGHITACTFFEPDYNDLAR